MNTAEINDLIAHYIPAFLRCMHEFSTKVGTFNSTGGTSLPPIAHRTVHQNLQNLASTCRLLLKPGACLHKRTDGLLTETHAVVFVHLLRQ